MSFNKLKHRVKTKAPEEEFIVKLPENHTVLGSDLNMVCVIKRLNNNTLKYIYTSEDNEELKYLVLNILDSCIDQIHILSGGRSCGSNNFFEDVLINKAEAFISYLFDPIYDEDTAEPYNVEFKRKLANKPYNYGAKLKEFLTAIKYELNSFNSFELFRHAMHNVKLQITDAQNMFMEVAKNQNKMIELKKAVFNHTSDCSVEKHKVNLVYAASCDSLQKLFIENIVRLRYAALYEKGRFEQNNIKCERERQELENIISKYSLKIDNENRAHSEILYYIVANQQELKESIKIWVEKYNTDMESSQFVILQTKDQLDEIKKKNEELKILLAQHKKAIEDFTEYTEKKRENEEKQERRITAAIKIQAWWRGVRCRRRLNPKFRKKNLKDKHKKKKKKAI